MELDLQGKLASEGLDMSAQPASKAVQRKVKWAQDRGSWAACTELQGHSEELCSLWTKVYMLVAA